MAVEITDNNLLIHELQLGEQLNACVHSKRRSDFSLLLAMLTDNVKEHSQFFVPETVKKIVSSTDESLRKEFKLPNKVELGVKAGDSLAHFNQANLIKNNNLTDIHLLNALQPKPLAFRDDNSHIEFDVLSNTSLYCQKKMQQSRAASTSAAQDNILNEQLLFNAKAWLRTVQSSIVQSALI